MARLMAIKGHRCGGRRITQKDGGMGAAIVSLNDRVAAHGVVVFGPHRHILALEDSPGHAPF